MIKLVIFFLIMVILLATMLFLWPFRKFIYYFNQIPNQLILILVLGVLMALELQTSLKENQRVTYGSLMVIQLVILMAINIFFSVFQGVWTVLKFFRKRKERKELSSKTEVRTGAFQSGYVALKDNVRSQDQNQIDPLEFNFGEEEEKKIDNEAKRVPFKTKAKITVNNNNSKLAQKKFIFREKKKHLELAKGDKVCSNDKRIRESENREIDKL